MKKLCAYLRAKTAQGFTLIETMVAVSLLTVAIVAPMSLVSQSLASAFYSRDQITAFNLAQEGIEGVRAIRDGNILSNALDNTALNLLEGITQCINTSCTIDARQSSAAAAIQTCSGTCPPLQTDGTLYGYASGDRSNPNRDPNWSDTKFTRTMTAVYAGPSGQNGGQDVIRVSVTVSWYTNGGRPRSFTIYENMYRWVQDGAAAQ